MLKSRNTLFHINLVSFVFLPKIFKSLDPSKSHLAGFSLFLSQKPPQFPPGGSIRPGEIMAAVRTPKLGVRAKKSRGRPLKRPYLGVYREGTEPDEAAGPRGPDPPTSHRSPRGEDAEERAERKKRLGQTRGGVAAERGWEERYNGRG